MKIRRLLSLCMILCLVFSVFSVGFTASAAETEIAETSAESEVVQTGADIYGLADNVQDGQILQCWNWSYNNIKANLQKIAQQGFSAIQTSPIQPIKEQTTEYWNTVMNSSWVIYQPVAFNIEDNYRNVQGTEKEFRAMCEEAHKYGIKVIVDTVFNHMANDMSGNTIHPWIPSEIRTNSDCWHDISKNTYNYDDRYEVTQYCLTGLPDLNTSNSIVQKHCKNFLKAAIDAGADGFRFDAVKHIETPDDSSSFASDFWPNVLNAATEYAQETRGFTPYYYGELLGSPGSGLSVSAYTKYMSVTDPGSSDSIRNGVCNGSASKAASGGISNGASKNKVVQWTESHDNHKDNGTNFISENNINKTWAMVGSKDDVCSLYLARPENMDTTMMGDADVTSWSYPEVRAVNRFKNAFIGQSEYLSSYYNLACVERGTSGMVIVNTGGTYYDDISVPVHKMASGTYKDVITGNTFKVSGGYITGDIGDTGIAVVYNEDSTGGFTAGQVTDIAIAGSFNDWSTTTHKMIAKDANSASVSMFLEAGTYNFKVTANGVWYGNSGTIEDETGSEGWTFKSSKDDNGTLVATGGKYTFTFIVTTGKLIVEHDSSADNTSEYYLKGTFNDWDTSNPMTYVSGTNSVTTEITLEAGTYTFKLHNSDLDDWYGNAGTINDYTNDTGWTMSPSVSTKCTLIATGGTYTFTFNLSTQKLVVKAEINAEPTPDPEPDPEPVTYTVVFEDFDGTILSTQVVEEGASAIAPADPTREADAQYTYTFSGWDTDYTNIKKDTTVTAIYTGTTNKYTVVFTDYDGTVLSTQEVEYGSAATAPDEPARDGFTFTGWNASFDSVKSDLTVVAQYTSAITYLKGTFNNWDESAVMQESENSEILTTTLNLEAGTYTFKIHSLEIWYGNNGTIEDTTTATSSIGWEFKTGRGNCTLNASGGTYIFNFNKTTHYLEILYIAPEYTVTFKDFDGTVLSTQTVKYGEAATAPAVPEREGFEFTEWDADFTNITGDLTVTAVYTEIAKVYYTVTFKDFDGTILSTQVVEEGASAIAPADPTREADAQYTYTFSGWDIDFTNIKKDTTVTAIYTGTANKYTVVFTDYDGTVLSTQTVKYGEAATAPAVPEREGFEFTEWDADFTNITGDLTVTAVYTEIAKVYYTVTFKDFDGTILSTQVVEEGASAIAPKNPSRTGYIFKGWDTDFSNVKSDITVMAKYSQIIVATTGKLRVDIAGGTGFKISIDGGNLRPQGSYYQNTKMNIGSTVKIVANNTTDAEFVGWMNEAGALVSVTDTYTFVTSGNDYYKAVYLTEVEGANAVTFKNGKAASGNGQILDIQYYTAGDEIEFPDAPTQAGYNFIGWSMTAEEIQAALAEGQDVTVTAKWEIAKVYVTITVNGGAVTSGSLTDGKGLAYNAYTVTANAAAEGKKFAYWTDADGNIVSYNATYKFYPATDTELTAIYVAEDENVEKKGLVSIAGDPTTDGTKISYTISWEVDENIGTVTNYGILFANIEDYNEETFYHNSGDSKIFDRAVSANKNTDTKSLTLSQNQGIAYDNTYVAKAFVVYIDAATGEAVTVYSDVITTFKPAP